MLFLPPLVLTLQADSDVYACTMNNEVIRSRNVETGYNSVLTTKVRYQTRLNLFLKNHLFKSCLIRKVLFVCLFVVGFLITNINSFQSFVLSLFR